MIYKIRAILDDQTDVFRDVAISSESTLEDLHNSLSQAFGFDGIEMATFYGCDQEWNQGQEYPIVDLGFEDDTVLMRDTPISSILTADNPKLIYIYDLLQMWTFFVELAAVESDESSTDLPQLLFSFGELPSEAPEKHFKSEKGSSEDDFYGDTDEDFSDEFDDFSDYSDSDYDDYN
ncbi:MAG: IS1096 element passenger TnpR family protein [Flavobacteriaceae bacterium]|jgi:hypothetical protein|nr:hypothetical protein [Flavobacteriaceae bacterium]MDC3403100.1 plasmid pRiA4b ORF-3 family protein [Flavobacteriaceae bacterium]